MKKWKDLIGLALTLAFGAFIWMSGAQILALLLGGANSVSYDPKSRVLGITHLTDYRNESNMKDTVTGQEEMILVPRNPTKEMLEAGWYEAHEEDAAGVWREMIKVWESGQNTKLCF